MSFWASSTWTSMKDYKTTEPAFIGNHLTILLLETHTHNIKSPEQQLPCKLERVWEMVKKQTELTDNRPAFWIPKNFIVDSMQAWDFQISFLMWHRWWIESPWCTCFSFLHRHCLFPCTSYMISFISMWGSPLQASSRKKKFGQSFVFLDHHNNQRP